MSRSNRKNSSNQSVPISPEEKTYSRRTSTSDQESPTVVLHTREEKKLVSPFAQLLPQAVMTNLMKIAEPKDVIRLTIASRANRAAINKVPLDLTDIPLSLTQVQKYFSRMKEPQVKLIALNIHIQQGEEEMFLPLKITTELSALNIDIYPGGDFHFFLNNLDKCQNLDSCTLSRNISVNGMGYFNTMNSLKELTIYNARDMQTFTGLEQCENLKKLELRNCVNLLSLHGIEQCLGLEEITLMGCAKFIDITALSDHTNLKKITAYGDYNHDFNLAGLDTCTGLTHLIISGFDEIDFFFSPEEKDRDEYIPNSLQYMHVHANLPRFLNNFGKHTNLEEVFLYEDKNSVDLSFLRECPNVTNLVLTIMPRLTSLLGINYCTKLKELSIAGCKNFANLDSLKPCNKLSKLILSDCDNLVDITGLEFKTELKEIFLYNCGIKYLLGLRGCTVLENFTCIANPITNLQGLDKCPALMQVSIVNCNISTIKHLRKCPKLKSLSIRVAPTLVSLQGLENCAELEKVIIAGSRNLTDIMALQTCTKLHTLSLTLSANLADISTLAENTNIQVLVISQCPKVISLKGLGSMTKLKYLAVDGTGIITLKGIETCRSLKRLNVDACDGLTSLEGVPKSIEIISADECSQLEDIYALAQCIQLRELSLEDDIRIYDTTSLEACINLEKLVLKGCTSIQRMVTLSKLHNLIDLRVNPLQPKEYENLFVPEMYG